MVNFKEIYHFSRFQRGPTFSRGGGGRGVQLFPGGWGPIAIETHITCDFPRGSGPPVPPLDPHLPHTLNSFKHRNPTYLLAVLIDFSLTVKTAILIFIYGRGSTVSNVREGKSVLIYNLVNT